MQRHRPAVDRQVPGAFTPAGRHPKQDRSVRRQLLDPAGRAAAVEVTGRCAEEHVLARKPPRHERRVAQLAHPHGDVDGEAHAFGPQTTLILRRNQLHQIFNTGSAPMEILGIFGATPVNTFLPNNEKLEVPWRS